VIEKLHLGSLNEQNVQQPNTYTTSPSELYVKEKFEHIKKDRIVFRGFIVAVEVVPVIEYHDDLRHVNLSLTLSFSGAVRLTLIVILLEQLREVFIIIE